MPGSKPTNEEVIRKNLALSPDVPLDVKLATNWTKGLWANYQMIRGNLTPRHRGIIDDWFETQGIMHEVSAPAPKKAPAKDVTPVKQVWGEAKLEVYADPFFKFVRNIVKGHGDRYAGKRGLNFVVNEIIGATDTKSMWRAIRDDDTGDKNGELSDKPKKGRESEGGLPVEETGGADSGGELQENVRERKEGSVKKTG